MRRREFIQSLGGALSLWAPAVFAQQPTSTKRIAIVSATIPSEQIRYHPNYRPFLDELDHLGFVEGQNLGVEFYSGNGVRSSYAALARAVVSTKPDAILTTGGPLSSEFKAATTSIPVVTVIADPVALGLTPSLAKPGANLTGITSDAGLEIIGKRLQLLIETKPDIVKAGYLATSRNWNGPVGAAVRDLVQRTRIGLTAIVLDDSLSEAAYLEAFRSVARARMDAILISEELEHLSYTDALIRLVAEAQIPAMYPYRDYAVAGGLIAYCVDLPDVFRRAAGPMAEVLRGKNPADIPFFQPTKFQLVINTKAALAIRLEIPPSLLARADEVIE